MRNPFKRLAAYMRSKWYGHYVLAKNRIKFSPAVYKHVAEELEFVCSIPKEEYGAFMTHVVTPALVANEFTYQLWLRFALKEFYAVALNSPRAKKLEKEIQPRILRLRKLVDYLIRHYTPKSQLNSSIDFERLLVALVDADHYVGVRLLQVLSIFGDRLPNRNLGGGGLVAPNYVHDTTGTGYAVANGFLNDLVSQQQHNVLRRLGSHIQSEVREGLQYFGNLAYRVADYIGAFSGNAAAVVPQGARLPQAKPFSPLSLGRVGEDDVRFAPIKTAIIALNAVLDRAINAANNAMADYEAAMYRTEILKAIADLVVAIKVDPAAVARPRAAAAAAAAAAPARAARVAVAAATAVAAAAAAAKNPNRLVDSLLLSLLEPLSIKMNSVRKLLPLREHANDQLDQKWSRFVAWVVRHQYGKNVDNATLTRIRNAYGLNRYVGAVYFTVSSLLLAGAITGAGFGYGLTNSARVTMEVLTIVLSDNVKETFLRNVQDSYFLTMGLFIATAFFLVKAMIWTGMMVKDLLWAKLGGNPWVGSGTALVNGQMRSFMAESLSRPAAGGMGQGVLATDPYREFSDDRIFFPRDTLRGEHRSANLRIAPAALGGAGAANTAAPHMPSGYYSRGGVGAVLFPLFRGAPVVAAAPVAPFAAAPLLPGGGRAAAAAAACRRLRRCLPC